MKKYLYLSISILIMNICYSQCEGDTNLDEIVNVQDVILTLNHILGVELLDVI